MGGELRLKVLRQDPAEGPTVEIFVTGSEDGESAWVVAVLPGGERVDVLELYSAGGKIGLSLHIVSDEFFWTDGCCNVNRQSGGGCICGKGEV